jgi:hypothetical protein
MANGSPQLEGSAMTEQSGGSFSPDVSDEALEIVGHAGKEKSKFTLGYCTAIDTCPHEPTTRCANGQRIAATQRISRPDLLRV